MEHTKIDSIIEKSDYVQDLLGNVPPAILRYGSVFLFCFLMCALLLSYFVKYPETVDAKITITSETPSIHIFSAASGRLKELFTTNGSQVSANSPIALIENTASLADINTVTQLLSALDSLTSYEQINEFNPSSTLSLGTVQNSYADLTLSIQNLKYFLKENSFLTKELGLASDIKFLIQMGQTLNRQQRLAESATLNAKSHFDRTQRLHEEKVISDYDMEIVQSALLKSNIDLENINGLIINNKIQVQEKETALEQLRLERNEFAVQSFASLKDMIPTLKSQIETWKLTYLIASPVSGRISFHSIWSKNQFITSNQELFVVTPEHNEKLVGKLILPELNSGKVRKGQTVIVKLNGFNYKEYGVLKGLVSSISLTTKENFYSVDVSFPAELITTYGRRIPDGKEKQGTASVVTEDLRLIERVFYNFKNAFKNN